jgi:hypothetical protein
MDFNEKVTRANDGVELILRKIGAGRKQLGVYGEDLETNKLFFGNETRLVKDSPLLREIDRLQVPVDGFFEKREKLKVPGPENEFIDLNEEEFSIKAKEAGKWLAKRTHKEFNKPWYKVLSDKEKKEQILKWLGNASAHADGTIFNRAMARYKTKR